MNELHGRTIEGQIQAANAPVDQDPDSVFMDALDALLNTPNVESVKWTQYTPYFNDGEPCVFGVHGSRVRFADMPENAGDYGDGFVGEWDFYGDKDKVSVNRRKLVLDFDNILGNGKHYVLLGSKFGDHAEVTATKDKFVVESYDHD